jgi:hypothetical protein
VKNLVVKLRTGSRKGLASAWKHQILRAAQNDIINMFACRSLSMCAEDRKIADLAIIGRCYFPGYKPFAVEEIT